MNPVMVREMKERVRSPKAVIILSIYLGILSLIMLLIYHFTSRSIAVSSFSPFSSQTSLGSLIYETVLLVMLGMICLIAPTLSAASISSEREKRSLHLLQITLLKPRAIALGKVGSSLAYSLLLLLAPAPLFAIPLALGGVSLWSVGRSAVAMTAIALFLASMATYFSSIIKRTQFALVAAGAVVLFYSIGTLVTWIIEVETSQGQADGTVSVYFNPITALASAAGSGSFQDGPLSAIYSEVSGSAFSSAPGSFSAAGAGRYVWAFHSFLLVAISALFMFLSAHRLRAPAPKFVIGARGS